MEYRCKCRKVCKDWTELEEHWKKFKGEEHDTADIISPGGDSK